MGVQSGKDILENSSTVPYEVKHTLIIWPSNFTLTYIYLRKMKTFSHKDLYIDIYNTFFYGKKHDIVQIFFNGWMDNSTLIYPYNGMYL